MPVRWVSFEKGGYYHIYNRGVAKQVIFREEENYTYLLRLLKKYVVQLDIAIIAYCLMPNHYHLVVRQNGKEPAGLLPQRVFNAYSKAFNKRFERSGTLFEGRYKAIPIENEKYLLQVCRYVHANPVKDGIVETLADWPFSNYLEWIERRNGTLVDRDLVKRYFAQADDYAEFVHAYLLGRVDLPQEVRRHLEQW